MDCVYLGRKNMCIGIIADFSIFFICQGRLAAFFYFSVPLIVVQYVEDNGAQPNVID